MSAKEIEIIVDKNNKVDLKQVIEMKIEYETIINNLEEKNQQLQQRTEKAIEITYMLLENSADNQLIAEEEMDYFKWLDLTLEKQLQILKGEEK